MSTVKLHPELADPSVLSDAQLELEVRELMEAIDREKYTWRCDRPFCDGLPHPGYLHRHARTSQLGPGYDSWSTWLIMTGRGWGKTRTGAEQVRDWALSEPMMIAVVGETHVKVREICFEHKTSGLLAVIPPEHVKRYHKSAGDTYLELTNGSVIRAFSAQQPDAPRGYAFRKAWLDEFAAMPAGKVTKKGSAGDPQPEGGPAQAVLDNIWFALRESPDPQVVITTTPRPRPQIRRLVAEHREAIDVAGYDWRTPDVQLAARPPVAITTGTMRDNAANLSQVALDRLTDAYAGTRLGQQELDGILLTDTPGAQWLAWMFDVPNFRLIPAAVPQLARRVVAMDPAVSSDASSDLCGLTVAGRDYGWPVFAFEDHRPHGYVLHAEQIRDTPHARARRAITLYWQYQADEIVVEANNGGDWIPAVIHMLDPRVPVRIVHAKDGKRTRAQPVSSLYEQARVHHVGDPREFDELETQLTDWTGEGGEDSPDLMDSLVWALWALFIENSEVRIGDGEDNRLDGRGR